MDILRKRYVDIGDHVKKGQLLALIDAPDLDQQVDQAREQLQPGRGAVSAAAGATGSESRDLGALADAGGEGRVLAAGWRSARGGLQYAGSGGRFGPAQRGELSRQPGAA